MNLTECSFFNQLEAIMVEMQDTKSGVKGSEQKLNVTTIPHVVTGKKKKTFHVYFKSNNFLSVAEC